MKKSTKVEVTKPQGKKVSNGKNQVTPGAVKVVPKLSSSVEQRKVEPKPERKPGLKRAAIEKRELFFLKHGEAIKKLWKKIPTTKIPIELKIDDPSRKLTYYTLNRLGLLKTKYEQITLEQEKHLSAETKAR